MKDHYTLTVLYDKVIDKNSFSSLCSRAEKYFTEKQEICFVCKSPKELYELQKAISTTFRIRELHSADPSIKEVFENVLKEVTKDNSNND